MNPGDVDLPRTFSVAVPFLPVAASGSMNGILRDESLADVRHDQLRDADFHKMLRWYPSAWRERNSAAVVSILLDQAEALGRDRPGAADRLALALGGIWERFVAPARLSRGAVVALALNAAFSVFYFVFIAWGPGIEFAGTVGPFTNPSVIAGTLFVFALGFAVAGRGRTARLLSGLGIAVVVAVGILSQTFTWLGPSWSTVAIFAGFAFFAVFPPQSPRRTFWTIAALSSLVAVLTVVPIAWAGLIAYRPAILAAEIVLSAGIVAFGVRIITRLRTIGEAVRKERS